MRRQSVSDDANTCRCSLAGGAFSDAAPGLVVLGGQGISSPVFEVASCCRLPSSLWTRCSSAATLQ
ncbi:hypothetical protein MINT15_06290 [Saccharomonospora viridis]|uniref:Uncharacterized protein n=1 Tax=Saccharomonospora viridis TaxID=1852 RepID=A0A837DDJ2_9PSEU|nr:hypothetical protein MINT15_06290 [Saccharomonospora viridis]